MREMYGHSTTSHIYEAVILVIQLGTNDQIGENTGQVSTSSTTYSSTVSVNFTPPSAGDYLIIACCDTLYTGVSRSKCRVYNGSAGYCDSVVYISDGADEPPYFTMIYAVGLSGSQTWELDWARATGSGSAYCRNRRIAAIRLADFENVYIGEDRTTHTTTSGTDADLITVTNTPVAVDHIVCATNLVASTDTSETTFNRGKIRVNDIAIGSTFSATASDTGGFNAPWMCFRKRTESAISTIWKTQYARETGTATCYVSDAVLAIMQVESAPVPLFDKYAAAGMLNVMLLDTDLL